jgi:hypothetical protein
MVLSCPAVGGRVSCSNIARTIFATVELPLTRVSVKVLLSGGAKLISAVISAAGWLASAPKAVYSRVILYDRDKAGFFCSTSSIEGTITARSGTAGFDSAVEFWACTGSTVIASVRTASAPGRDMAIPSAIVSCLLRAIA